MVGSGERMFAGIDLNILLAVLAGVVMTTALLWPTLHYEFRLRTAAERKLDDARKALASYQTDGQENRDIFDGLIDTFPLPVFVTTRDRVVVLVNRAALQLVQMPQQRVVGRVLATIVQDYDTT